MNMNDDYNFRKKATFDKLVVALDDLTARQRSVLRFVAQELTSKEIAETLHISSQTVDCHRKAILHTLGLRGKVEFRKALRLLDNHLNSTHPMPVT